MAVSPPGAGDLRPSPDAVEYGLGAADLAAGHAPRVGIGERRGALALPLRLPLLAAPWCASRPGRGRPAGGGGARLRSRRRRTGLGRGSERGRAFGGARRRARLVGRGGGLGGRPDPDQPLLRRVRPAGDGRGAGGGPRRPAGPPVRLRCGAAGAARPERAGERRGPGWPLLLGSPWRSRCACPTCTCCPPPGPPWRWPRRAAPAGPAPPSAAGLGAGLAAPAGRQWITFGGPLRTGYHLWTPEWAGGERRAVRAALRPRPAGPAGRARAGQPGPLGERLGRPAGGRRRRRPVGSPLHATAAGVLLVAGAVRRGRCVRAARLAGRAGRTLGRVRSPPGSLGAVLCYGPYYYQDVRYLSPWVPLWLLLGAAGWLWPVRRWAPAGAGGRSSPPGPGPPPRERWSGPRPGARVARRRGPEPPRLAQMEALARDLPPDAWLISAIDGPLLQYHVLRHSARRYVPLARGLEFVDKPPFRALPDAEAMAAQVAARAALGRPDAVVIDRWSLEFAEGLPDYRRALERCWRGWSWSPGGRRAPGIRPSTPCAGAPRRGPWPPTRCATATPSGTAVAPSSSSPGANGGTSPTWPAPGRGAALGVRAPAAGRRAGGGARGPAAPRLSGPRSPLPLSRSGVAGATAPQPGARRRVLS